MIEIKIPKAPTDFVPVKLTKWLVNAGDQVKQATPIAIAETEKITFEILAPSSGTIRELKISEGSVVTVGTILAYLDPLDGSEEYKTSSPT